MHYWLLGVCTQTACYCATLPRPPAVWDLGGQTSIRPYWRCYYANTDAIIYVVDSADRDRLAISKSELVSMLEVTNYLEFLLLL